jgi:hypothetical protein
LVCLSILLFPNSYVIFFVIFYLLLLLIYTVCLVKYFSNLGCAFEIHVVMRHKLIWIWCPGPCCWWTKQNIAVSLFWGPPPSMPHFLDCLIYVWTWIESWEITWEQNGLFGLYNYVGCLHNFLCWFTEM